MKNPEWETEIERGGMALSLSCPDCGAHESRGILHFAANEKRIVALARDLYRSIEHRTCPACGVHRGFDRLDVPNGLRCRACGAEMSTADVLSGGPVAHPTR
jgi:rubredoxin